jgi:hypothetical protein
MTRREREFMILFNALWYKDFPITKDFLGFGTRAGWTLHVATAVREAANLMGLFMTFETGGRTDGEIHMFDETADSERQTWAKVEWEWTEANTKKLDELLNIVSAHWTGAEKPLLCFFLERTRYARVPASTPKRRVPIFGKLLTYRFAPNQNGTTTMTRPRNQPAYPWNVKGTKWAAHRSLDLPVASFETEEEE